MKSFKIKHLVRWGVFGIAMLAFLRPAGALENSQTVKVTPLLKTTTSWNQKAVVYPEGNPEVTAVLVEMAPGAETGWHLHPVPTLGIVQEGELEVTLKDGQVKRVKTGEAMVEVINTLHNGRNVGTVPVKLWVFFVGVEGKTLTIKESDVKP